MTTTRYFKLITLPYIKRILKNWDWPHVDAATLPPSAQNTNGEYTDKYLEEWEKAGQPHSWDILNQKHFDVNGEGFILVRDDGHGYTLLVYDTQQRVKGMKIKWATFKDYVVDVRNRFVVLCEPYGMDDAKVFIPYCEN